MAPSRDGLDRAISQFTLGKLPYSELPDLACNALELGIDGPSIRRLASLQKPSYFEVGHLFEQALREMGFRQWSKRDAAVFLSKAIGREVLAGQKEPLSGADEIWELCCAGDYRQELLVFGQLDQEFQIPQLLGEYRILVAESQRTYVPD
jgi:hypothetical protein